MELDHALNRERRRLRRGYHGRWVAGVATGLADYVDVDVVVVRIGLVALTVMGGVGVPLYLAAWLLVPDEGDDESVAEQLLGRPGVGGGWPPPRAHESTGAGWTAGPTGGGGADAA
jgi:phage shock protein PspC (stress-responsive transcriptional regulator)